MTTRMRVLQSHPCPAVGTWWNDKDGDLLIIHEGGQWSWAGSEQRYPWPANRARLDDTYPLFPLTETDPPPVTNWDAEVPVARAVATLGSILPGLGQSIAALRDLTVRPDAPGPQPFREVDKPIPLVVAAPQPPVAAPDSPAATPEMVDAVAQVFFDAGDWLTSATLTRKAATMRAADDAAIAAHDAYFTGTGITWAHTNTLARALWHDVVAAIRAHDKETA